MNRAVIPFPASDPSDQEITVRELVRLYLEHDGPELSPKVERWRKHQLGEFVAKFGSFTVSQLHASDLKSWVRNHPRWRADDTKRNGIRAVKRVFSWAIDDGRIDKNPFRKANWPAGKPRRSMTDEEFRACLRNSSDAAFRRVLIFIAETGCRPCEMSGLMWDQVNWAEAIAVIVEHKTAKKTGRPRTLYLTPVAVKLLRFLHRQPKRGERVFANRLGRRWQPSTISQRMEKLRKRCGLPDDCKLYGLRHRYGNKSQAAGNDIRTTADLMGHASTRTTERHYLHAEERRKSLLDAAARARNAK